MCLCLHSINNRERAYIICTKTPSVSEECVKEIENERYDAHGKREKEKNCKCKQINNLMLPFNPH